MEGVPTKILGQATCVDLGISQFVIIYVLRSFWDDTLFGSDLAPYLNKTEFKRLVNVYMEDTGRCEGVNCECHV